MERYIRIEAVKADNGRKLIPIFELSARLDEDGYIELYTKDRKETFGLTDEPVSVLYDLLEKKIVGPGRTIDILEECRYEVGDEVLVDSEKEARALCIDKIKDIKIGRLNYVDYAKKEEFERRNYHETIVSDTGDKDSDIVQVNMYNSKYILESGREIEWEHQIHKLVEK